MIITNIKPDLKGLNGCIITLHTDVKLFLFT